jgi:hypothetical protein
MLAPKNTTYLQIYFLLQKIKTYVLLPQPSALLSRETLHKVKNHGSRAEIVIVTFTNRI